MGLHELAHPSQCKRKTVGCRFKYQNIAGILFCCCIHTNTCSMNKIVAQAHVRLCFAFTIALIMCIYFSVRCVSMCQRTSDFCMWHLMFTSCGLALLFVWALPHLIPVSALGSSPLEGFISPADPEDLCCFRLSVGPSPQPCCSSLTQHGMCYSSHVVMSCQKQPWQMLLFCLWNDHVGLTLQSTIIIHSWLLCTCKMCFVGTRCHKSKAGGRFICKVIETQHSSLHASAVKKAEKTTGKTWV